MQTVRTTGRIEHDTQALIATLLRHSLEPMTLEELLEKTLDLLFSIPWLKIKAKGSIFLVENEPDVLILKVQRDLAVPLLSACANVPFGHCLCGRAASSGALVYAGCVDHRHETQFDGMAPHGHVCVPIKYNDKVIGVINLYLEEHYVIGKDEEIFLNSVADTLASTLGRRAAEQTLLDNEMRFLQLVEAASGWEWRTDAQGIYTHLGPYIYDALGYTPEEIIGQHLLKMVDTEESFSFTLQYSRLTSQHERFLRLENIRRSRDGRLVTIETSGVPVFDANGDFSGYHGIDHDVTERVRSEQKIRGLLESTPDAVVISDSRGRIELVNHKTEELFGYTREELQGANVQLLLANKLSSKEAECQIGIGGWPICSGHQDCKCHGRHKSGAVFPVEFSRDPTSKAGGDLTTVLIRDITMRTAAEHEMKRLASFPEHSPNPIIEISADNTITYANASAALLFPELAQRGVTHPVIVEIQQDIEQMRTENHSPIARRVEFGGMSLSLTINYIPATDIVHIYVLDITNLAILTLELEHQARHDALTDLINRSEFETRLTQLLANSENADAQHALLYIDLDQFKLVNDSCGHLAGDDLLKQLSALLKSQVRKYDTLARLGGDEFGLILMNCPLAMARQIADQIIETVNQFSFAWEKRVFRVGASIGLVALDTSCGDISTLLSLADSACYVAKEQGRNRVHVLHPDDAALAQRRGQIEWATRIREALEQNRLQLYQHRYQPINPDLPSCECREILLRMLDNDGNIILPMAFIPAAERHGIMLQVDRWVVQSTLASLPKCDLSGVAMISINLSAQSLCDKGFLEFVKQQLTQQPMLAGLICFEITETAAIANLTDALQFMSALKKLGCRFALDDFGVGLSSLAYLRNLPVDYLKIYGGIVKDIVTDPVSRTMVMAIREISNVMGIRTVAEYVESPEILAMLRTMGIDYAQGDAVGLPEPLLTDQATASSALADTH
jgi:diguanylate cyclase (GGDEF)-like protein/PAS domain S-box-containing protein